MRENELQFGRVIPRFLRVVQHAWSRHGRALLSSAKEADASRAATYDIEGLAFDRENKRVEAQQAYAKAVDLNSANFYTYLRLANLIQAANTVGPRADSYATVQKLLAKSIALNDAFAPSFASLAGVLLQINQPQSAIGLALRAASLEPGRFSDQLLVARVFARMARREDAQAAAQQAMELARTDPERQSVKTLLDSLARGGPGAAGMRTGGGAGAIPARPPPTPAPGGPVRVGDEDSLTGGTRWFEAKLRYLSTVGGDEPGAGGAVNGAGFP